MASWRRIKRESKSIASINRIVFAISKKLRFARRVPKAMAGKPRRLSAEAFIRLFHLEPVRMLKLWFSAARLPPTLEGDSNHPVAGSLHPLARPLALFNPTRQPRQPSKASASVAATRPGFLNLAGRFFVLVAEMITKGAGTRRQADSYFVLICSVTLPRNPPGHWQNPIVRHYGTENGKKLSRCSSGVEQLIRNEQVVGSNPTSGSI
jgi:hypothetical protein